MKRSLSLVLFLLLSAGCASAPPGQAEAPVHVVIVHTTDVHGWFAGHTEVPQGGGPGVHWGGLSILASYVETLRQQHQNRVILLDSGDMLQGTLESNLFEGEPVIRGYNALGYSAAAVGNHEFDFGPVGPNAVVRDPGEDALGVVKRNARIARFPFLSANMTEKATGQTPAWAKRSTIVEMGGAKIGIVGLSTPDTPNVTMAVNVASLNFTDPVAATIKAAADLRAAGVDAVIGIGHMGGRCTDLNDPQNPASCEPDHETNRLLNALPKGTLDAYFGGHTHAQVRHWINGVPTAQALAYSRDFSTMDLWIDRNENRVVRAEIRPPTMLCAFVYDGTEACEPRSAPKGAQLVPRVFHGKTITPDVRMATLFEPYLTRVAAKRNERLGVRTGERFTRNYSRESALGNLVADAIRDVTGADFAFMNSGGIRADLRAGDLVYGDIFEVSPFDNFPTVVTLTGAQIVELLRLTTGGERGIMQVSGLKYTYDLARDADKPAGQRNRLVSVSLSDGSQLDPEKLYTVAMPDFVAAGGDRTDAVMKQVPAERIKTDLSRPLREIIIEGLKRRDTVTLLPRLEERITVLNPPAR